MLTNRDVVEHLENWAPKHLAYDWDPIGLQIGDLNSPCKKILVTLDVLESVVDEAIENDVNLIVAHHPLMFKPFDKIDLETPKGRIVKKLIQHEITVYAAHTNLDIAKGGVNDLLAERLGLMDLEVLVETEKEKLFKFVVFVPNDYEAEVRNAVSEAGAGHIGEYSHCTYRIEGRGTFKPLAGSEPFIGNQNELTKVEEVRLETIARESDLQGIIKAAKDAHPYEEMAYDIYPLEISGDSIGLGRIGFLEKEVPLKTFIADLKKALDVQNVRLTGNLKQNVKKVAILGGSGEKFYQYALNKGADVYVTGDVTFHHAQDAEALGLNLIDAGHYIEKIIKKGLKDYLTKMLNDDVKIIESEVNTDPFQYI